MISIIVPIYNLEDYIEKCIYSLVYQTYSDIEIILIDDGSTDHSLQICNKWAEKDRRIKVYYHENQGVSKTRNFGLSVMTGEYVFFLDGDDWIDLDCLEKMIAKMNEGIDIVNCDFTVEGNELNNKNFIHKEKCGVISTKECIVDFYDTLLYTQTIWAKLYKKELWNDIRFESIKFSEDSLAMFQIFTKSESVYCIKDKFYHYLQRSTSASNQKGESYYKDILYTLNYCFEMSINRYQTQVQKSGEQYINSGYALLKIYEEKKMKREAYELIENMKRIMHVGNIKIVTRAHKFLKLPPKIILFLIFVKRIMNS